MICMHMSHDLHTYHMICMHMSHGLHTHHMICMPMSHDLHTWVTDILVMGEEEMAAVCEQLGAGVAEGRVVQWHHHLP